MSPAELDQLEIFAQVDELLRKMQHWCLKDFTWEPLQQARALLLRLQPRLETLRIRLEAPLVVATFGGTGTGKSSLVNALVGQDVSSAGRERPTTRRPMIVKHEQTDLDVLQLPLGQWDVVSLNEPLLRDVVLIDCPDPDTTSHADENDSAQHSETNLATLRALLPYCDVLLYTSTQQKYRSARVGEEFDVAATGCRLIFVQTHADHDVDIRSDWRAQLESQFAVPDMFFVDSTRALAEQQAGQRPTGDFAKLQELLQSRFAAGERLAIRRANLLDLVDAALRRCEARLEAAGPAIERLQHGLQEVRQRTITTMSSALSDQLQASRHLWEQRLLSAVTQRWGLSPFSSLLRVYSGLGALMASASLARARSTAQLVLLGAVAGGKWLAERSKDRAAEYSFEEVAVLGIDPALQREARLVLRGYLHEARLDVSLDNATENRRDVAVLEAEFLQRARLQVDAIIDRVARKKSGWFARCGYELLFATYIVFVVGRAGQLFFYESLFQKQSLPTTDFYLSAAIFFVLWSAFLLISFLSRLRSGLNREIQQLAVTLAQERTEGSLFPTLDRALEDLQADRDRLLQLSASCQQLRVQVAVSVPLGERQAT